MHYDEGMELNLRAIRRAEAIGNTLQVPSEGPRILIYDIETMASLVYTWGQWKQNVIATERDWFMLSFAWKWYGGNGTRFVSLQQDPRIRRPIDDDRYVVNHLWSLFNAADVVIAHNGDNFDVKKANTRFLYHGLGPTSPYKSIDTLKEYRRYFSHYSAGLNELARYHNHGKKVEHIGFDLWLGCQAGDPASWREMERYNRRDVRLLEDVWLDARPWIGSPGKFAPMNYGLFMDSEDAICPKCGHKDLIWRGYHRTLVNNFRTRQCVVKSGGCGGYSRVRLSDPRTNRLELV